MFRITAAAASVTLSRCSRHHTSCQYDIGFPVGPSRSSRLVLGSPSAVMFTSVSERTVMRPETGERLAQSSALITQHCFLLPSPNARVDKALRDIHREVQDDEK